MKELFRPVVQEVVSGYEFCVTVHDNYRYKVQVDLEGQVIMADYGGPTGWCARVSNDANFLETVRYAMEGILEQDVEEFKAMRDHLNDKWREVAEAVRKEKINKWEF